LIPENAMPRSVENILVDTAKVSCAGDKESEHPRVFLVLNAEGFVDCPYCGKRFVLKECASKA